MTEAIDNHNESEIDDAEVVESLGNMFLVRIDGELKQVPATYKNELLYKHKLYEILNTDDNNSRVVISDEHDSENMIAIAPTENDSVYQIWLGDNPYPVMNPPSLAENVLKGIRDAIQSPSDYSKIKEVYHEIRSTKVRRKVIEKTASMFSRSEVIQEDDGWNILGIFKLTWDARVFLNTSSVEDQKSYRVSGSGVSEMDDAKEFLQLSISDDIIEQYRGQSVRVNYPIDSEINLSNSSEINKNCPSCDSNTGYEHYISEHNDIVDQRPVYVCSNDNCGQAWEEYELTEREIEFVSKANWLINHREKLNDEAFWDVIESYVWYSQDN